LISYYQEPQMEIGQWKAEICTLSGEIISVVGGEFDRGVIQRIQRFDDEGTPLVSEHDTSVIWKGIRVYTTSEEDSSGPLSLIAEYWAETHFGRSHFSTIGAWVQQIASGPTSQHSVEDFMEEMEEFFQCPEIPGWIQVEASTSSKTQEPMESQPTTKTFLRKRMEPIEISISDDDCIVLSMGADDNTAKLKIHPAQVDLLCQWIQEAKEAIESKSEGR